MNISVEMITTARETSIYLIAANCAIWPIDMKQAANACQRVVVDGKVLRVARYCRLNIHANK